MSSATVDQRFYGFDQSSLRGCEPYEPSIASSAPSTQSSVFSDDASAQSSIASSISDDFRLSQEDARDRQPQCTQAYYQQQQQQGANAEAIAHEQVKLQHLLQAAQRAARAPSYADVTSVPSEQRQHPRRSSLARNQKPPPLVRQCERKVNFVDNLVDSATQMVEVIWPLSVVPCKSEGGSGRGVLPLRTYIEETLRRSRTSYSTLQVALYYLILIKPYIPKSDFTMEQTMDCPASRALMCGRRMFLAALILASKYLQDRNYSAKAWSKMSGLKVNEINTNERTFLSKVCWKLHIPDSIFKRWTDVVLRYTPNMHPPSSDQGLAIPIATWKSIIPLLTPELDQVPMPDNKTVSAVKCSANYGFASPTTPTPPRSAINPMQIESTSHESTPTPLTVLPRFLEPKPELAPPTPALIRMGPLPTPQMTPSSVASSTPAASVCGSRRPSICSAMALAQKAGFNRCTMDGFPGNMPNMEKYHPSRRPSTTSESLRSSPESMISDRTRSSRASSISSVTTVSTTSSMAPNRACLARQASRRNAGLTALPAAVPEEKEGSVMKPIIISDDTEMVSSPEMADFTVSEKALHAPHRHSRHAPHPHPQASVNSTADNNKGRKRARPRGGRRSDLQEEIRILLEEDLDVMMDVDEEEEVASPSSASEYATKMLARSSTTTSDMCAKEMQPAAMLSRRESSRVPVQKNEGKKRTCCSASAMSISPSPLYGEVA